MTEDFSLARANVAILGLGLMGGSLALALRGHCGSLLGIDSHPPTLELAQSLAVVDRASANPVSLLPVADVIILAAPVPAIETLLGQLPAWTSHPAIVMDLGSTKRTIVEAMTRLPERFDPIGGHPICGKETLSLASAEATLFHGAKFCITPLPRTSKRAVSAAHAIIAAIGAHPVTVTAEQHDRMFASTSHLPYLLSSALALTAPGEAGPFIGPGFRSASRLAGTPSSMMAGVLHANRENVLAVLARLQSRLAELESALTSGNEAELTSLLDEARASYLDLISASDGSHKTAATR